MARPATNPMNVSAPAIPMTTVAPAATMTRLANATAGPVNDAGPVDRVILKDILNVSDAAMDQAMGIAYQLYLTGRFEDAETVCKGLIACDPRYWWPRSLYAAVLRQLGRYADALHEVEAGLEYQPEQPKLSLLRAELLITLSR